ncbi:MAG: glycosyltransferase family 39 protein [Patescibacteria group bacterium]
MKKFLNKIKNNKAEAFFLLAIIGVSIFLRFYKINELHFFTYDQARDDLIVKRMIVDKEWTLLGPQSSMRGVYLPPFYYYTLIPVLALSGLNPIGVDVYTAIIGVLTVVLVWFFLREVFNKHIGLFVAGLYATSPLIVELSHRAWNPNTLPFFVLLSLFFLYRLFYRKEAKYLIFSSLSLGYAVNLHYGAVCLLPLWFFALFWAGVSLKNIKRALFSLLIMAFYASPLFLFELRHDFMLSNNIFQYFFEGERVSVAPGAFLEPMLASLFQLFTALLSGSFIQTANYVPFQFLGKISSVMNFAPVSIVAHKPLLVSFQWWGVLLTGLIAASVFWFFVKYKSLAIKNLEKRKVFLLLCLGTVLVSGLMSRLYIGDFYFFYYLFIFTVPFLFLGFLFWCFWQKKLGRALVLLSFSGMIFFNLKNTLKFEKPERTIDDIIKVSKVLAQDVDDSKTFNIAANYRSPDRWDHNGVDYRYFIESYFGKRALSWQPEDYEKAQILYVVAEGGMEDPINSKIMEIYKFEPKEILEEFKVDDVIIYKLSK